MSLSVVILAAGQGTRMKSRLPKVLHHAAGRSLLGYMVNIAKQLEPEHIIIIVGHEAEQVRQAFAGDAALTFVEQREQLGTGHALMQARTTLAGSQNNVLVLNGDGPLLLEPDTLRELQHVQPEGGMAVLTCIASNPIGLGRILRQADGTVMGIVEEKDASDTERAITEINTGIFLFNRDALTLLDKLDNDNAQGEYYITDLLRLYLAAGKPVQALCKRDENQLLNCLVNDRVQLARVDKLLRDAIRERWLRAGVTMLAPEQTFIDDTVTLERDVMLYPGVWLGGTTTIGEGAKVLPHAVLTDCHITPHAVVKAGTVATGERFT
jgi:bifunctional UDP-N-acetylglucosamine pyrophosphorylase / glucosamine-1-phosphate N-acetyltransferase